MGSGSKFEEIKAGLIRAVQVEKLPPGTRLPSIRALADDHGVSLETAARAVRELRQEGLVDTRPGLGTFVTGRTASAADAVTLRIASGRWNMGSLCGIFVEEATERFQTAHPDVLVEFCPDGKDADVWMTTGSYVQTQAEEGSVLALDEIMGFDRAIDTKPLAPEAMELYERSGHVYGLPYYVSPVVVWVSRRLFKGAGVDVPGPEWDREAFIETVRRLHELLPEGVKPFELSPDLAHLMPWILQSGGTLEKIAAPERAGDWAFIRELASLSAPVERYGEKADARFVEGRLAMCPWGGRFEWEVRRSGGEAPVALPYPASRRKATFLMSEAFSISSRCAQPELALELLRELVSLESQRTLVAEDVRFPSHRDALEELLSSAADRASLDAHWRERLHAAPDVMRLGAVRVDIISHAVKPLWGSDEPLEDALGKAAAACGAVLANYMEAQDGRALARASD